MQVKDQDKLNSNMVGLNQIKILSHAEKNQWELCPKYHIGKKK